MAGLATGNGREAPNDKASRSTHPISLRNESVIREIWEKFTTSTLDGRRRIAIPICWGRGRSGFGFLVSAYALAVMAVSGAVVITLGLGPVVKHTPIFFFCSVMLSSWFGGMWPGIFAAFLSVVALDYYFIPPIYALGITLEEVPDMLAFVASAFFVSWLTGEQKRAKDSPIKVQDTRNANIREAARLGRTEGQVHSGSAQYKTAEVLRRRPHARAGQIASINGERESLPRASIISSEEESILCRKGDYWTIQYHGEIGHFKSIRGLYCLACLLGHPGREFHASEFFAPIAEMPVAAVRLTSGTFKEDGLEVRSMRSQDAGPILDRRAKAEYACRLSELRSELKEFEQLNDPERARKARQERDCIVEQLVVAAGLGGRDRRAASAAERARSAVTKRIKNAIRKIAETMPSLGHHLTAAINTGYFCSYNPDPDRPVTWEVRS
jgi:hypothetical protein